MIIERKITVGNLIHLVVLLVSIIYAFAQFNNRLDNVDTRFDNMTNQIKDQSTQMDNVQHQTIRIEHYLSSQDREYWRKTTNNGDR